MDKIFTKNIEHESAVKHVTGNAIYTDDISEPKNLLHAVIGYSNCSKGVIKKIDYKDVLSSEGVVDIITEKDIEGINDVGPIFKGDKIFTSKKINTKNTHGTGCTLSSAIATFYSCGKSIMKSCELGINYVNSAIKFNPKFGKGHGPINHLNSLIIKKN